MSTRHLMNLFTSKVAKSLVTWVFWERNSWWQIQNAVISEPSYMVWHVEPATQSSLSILKWLQWEYCVLGFLPTNQGSLKGKHAWFDHHVLLWLQVPFWWSRQRLSCNSGLFQRDQHKFLCSKKVQRGISSLLTTMYWLRLPFWWSRMEGKLL